VKGASLRPFFIAAGVVALLVLLQVISLLLSRAPALSYPDPTSYSYHGWRAVYTTFRGAGLPLQDLRTPFHRAKIPVSSVFVAAAPRTPFGYDESRALRNWLDDGGAFVFFTGSGQSFQQFTTESNLYDWIFPSLGGSRTYDDAPVFVRPPSAAGEERETLVTRRPAREPGCSQLKECFLTDHNDQVHGAVFERGKGLAYWFSSSDFLANGNILASDNFAYFYRFFSDLIRQRRSAFPGETPVIYVDFYHHGHLAPGAFRGWLERPYLLYLLILLFIWTYGERKGIVRYLPPERVFRGSEATVEMVARLWNYRDHSAWLLEQMKSYYERQFRKKGRDVAPLEKIYAEAARGKITGVHLVTFARAVARLQEDV